MTMSEDINNNNMPRIKLDEPVLIPNVNLKRHRRRSSHNAQDVSLQSIAKMDHARKYIGDMATKISVCLLLLSIQLRASLVKRKNMNKKRILSTVCIRMNQVILDAIIHNAKRWRQNPKLIYNAQGVNMLGIALKNARPTIGR
mmetsp:Transcript_56624/g.64190  ORF Transcript_56624/g.64190 Transcript_56624/m.64190 type:complete len:143 (-) Transcript_56624:186-614(-)